MPVSAPFRGLQATSLLVVLTYTCFFCARQCGRRDAKADTYLNAAERSAFEHGVSAEEGATAKRLSQVLGKEILFIDADADFHGCTIDGVIYLGAKSERSVLATVAHEYTHLLESKGLYDKLRGFVFDTLVGEGATEEDLRAAKRAKHALYAGLDDAKVDREIVAEFVETRLLTDEQVMREVVRRKGKTFARRLLDVLRGLIEKVKAALHIGNADAEQLRVLERGRDILAEVIRSEEVAEKTAVSFDLEQAAFEKQLDDWKDGLGKKYGSYNGTYFNLGTTPSVLVKHGAKQVPVIMYEECLVKITGGKHSISLDEIKKLPEQLNDPILLFKGSVPDSFVALTEMETKAGHDVVVAIHINRRMGRTVINKIASLHSRSNDYGVNLIENYVNNQIRLGNLLDASTKKAPMWFTSRGLQLPKLVQTIIDADTTISQNNSGVNSKYTQNSKNDADIDGFSVGGVDTDSEGIMKLDDANIDKTKEKMTWLEANDLLEKQRGLSYRFYASDDPMSRAGYAMFADDHEQNGGAYGGDKPRAFSVREDDLFRFGNCLKKSQKHGMRRTSTRHGFWKTMPN